MVFQMRLINVLTLEMSKFHQDEVPEYAILSHTWSANPQDELTLEEWATRGTNPKPGLDKILQLCERARQDDIQHVWCDTVCINKKDHVELEAAINAMFAWYRDAAVCYAYLSDVASLGDLPRSRWFTRGWTLQELVAPSRVVFFDSHWNILGTKASLQPVLSDVTGINEYFLAGGPETIHDAPVGMRMSWLARRTTAAVEDMAFCMLGILDVTVPLLYGHGINVFLMLQQELVRTSTDNSIFAWTPDAITNINGKPVQQPSIKPWVDLLAPAPSAFANYPRGFTPIECHNVPPSHSWFSLDKFGLDFQVDCVAREVPGSNTTHVVALLKDVGQSSTTGKTTMVGINLTWSRESKSWVRDLELPGLATVVVDDNHHETYEKLFIAPANNGGRLFKRVMQPSRPLKDLPSYKLHDSMAVTVSEKHLSRDSEHVTPQASSDPEQSPCLEGPIPGRNHALTERAWSWESLILMILRLMNDPVGLHIVILIVVAAFSHPQSTKASCPVCVCVQDTG